MDSYLVRKIVNKKEDFIRRHLVLSDTVVEKLRELDVIGEYAWRQLVADRGNTQRQLNLLFTALKYRGLTAFKAFLEVLRMTFHGWIADDIVGSVIEYENKTGNGNKTTINVSDILSRSYQESLVEQNTGYKPVLLAKSELPVLPYVFMKPTSLYSNSERSHKRDKRRRRRTPRDSYNINDPDVFNPYEVLSPIARAPENIRYLQNVFDKEKSSALKSMSLLRNEEHTIKSLLQQNLREQQDVLCRQDALYEIGDRFNQINKRASQLYKPTVHSERAKSRLRYLQRMPWADDDD